MFFFSLETIHTQYPNHEWLHIYTDGSSGPYGAPGSGFYCEGIFEGSVAMGINSTNLEAEIEAIYQALTGLPSITDYRKAVFLIDSQAAILALCSYQNDSSACLSNSHALASSILNTKWKVTYQRIPSHCGITGNK